MNLLVLSVGFSGVEHQVINNLIKSGVDVKIIEMKKFYSVWLYSILSTFRPSFSIKNWIKRAEHKYNKLHHTSRIFEMKSKWMENQVKKELAQFNHVLQISGTFSLHNLKENNDFNYYVLTDYTRALGKTEKLTENLTKEKIYSLALEKKLYQSCDGLFVPSSYIKDSLVSVYETESNHVHVIGYGSKYPIVNRSVVRANNILFVGVEFERKGGTQLLHVFQKMRQYVPDLELTIVGPRFNPCPNIIGVNYLGKITDDKVLSDVYLNASVFVLHPKAEPFGLVFLEAMSHGVPCIGTKLDAMP